MIEVPTRLEPCLIEAASGDLLDLVAELPALATALSSRLHPKTAANLADLVRVMNCYYSNLIEGYNTRPRDIERALINDLDADDARRDLQLEARAHICVQREIDRRFVAGNLPAATSADFIRWLHISFYQDAPTSQLLITGSGRTFTMMPGAFRTQPEHDVAVGRHVPPSSGVVESFMAHFENRYAQSRKGAAARILALAAAHHRLNYIHPFPDGNGRVSRLMSHAMALEAGIGANGLWSISRGLARGLNAPGDYKRMMDHADSPRQGDLDGRGNLSLAALTEFSIWFLQVCRDQIQFMAGLFELATLAGRLRGYAATKGWRPEAGRLLEEVLQRGEIARGDVPGITGLAERTARDLLGAVIDDGLLASDTPKGLVSLRFPVAALDVLFPRLFTEV